MEGKPAESTRTLDKESIYILQVSDAYELREPLSTEPDEEGTRPRARWSSACRPMPRNGGYLPVVEMARAVVATGFQGWLSVEIFDEGPDGKGKPRDDLEAETAELMCLTKAFIETVMEDAWAGARRSRRVVAQVRPILRSL